MKFIKKEHSGASHWHHYFALGKEEARIMLDMARKAYRYTPKTIYTQPIVHRLSSMIKAIQKAIPEFEQQPTTHSGDGLPDG